MIHINFFPLLFRFSWRVKPITLIFLYGNKKTRENIMQNWKRLRFYLIVFKYYLEKIRFFSARDDNSNDITVVLCEILPFALISHVCLSKEICWNIQNFFLFEKIHLIYFCIWLQFSIFLQHVPFRFRFSVF